MPLFHILFAGLLRSRKSLLLVLLQLRERPLTETGPCGLSAKKGFERPRMKGRICELSFADTRARRLSAKNGAESIFHDRLHFFSPSPTEKCGLNCKANANPLGFHFQGQCFDTLSRAFGGMREGIYWKLSPPVSIGSDFTAGRVFSE